MNTTIGTELPLIIPVNYCTFWSCGTFESRFGSTVSRFFLSVVFVKGFSQIWPSGEFIQSVLQVKLQIVTVNMIINMYIFGVGFCFPSVFTWD